MEVLDFLDGNGYNGIGMVIYLDGLVLDGWI